MNQLTLSECSKRKLDETYLVVYAIKNEINIKKGDYIEKSDVYTLIGIDLKGFRQFINIYQDKVYSIDRIEVFTDSNDVVLAGIGKMYYGKPKYLKFFYDPIVGSYTDYFDPDEYYLDFFMLYTIKETQEIIN